MMVSFVMWVMVGVAAGGIIETVDVCQCDESVCFLQRGTRLTASDCSGHIRTTGPGFVTWVDRVVLERFSSVVLERSTLSCQSLQNKTATGVLIVDGVVCAASASTAKVELFTHLIY